MQIKAMRERERREAKEGAENYSFEETSSSKIAIEVLLGFGVKESASRTIKLGKHFKRQRDLSTLWVK